MRGSPATAVRRVNIFGKLLGFVVGIAFFHHPLAILVCVGLGHIFDRSFGAFNPLAGIAPLSFVEPLFGIAGAIAKSDGRVSQEEIDAAERLIQRLQLSGNQRNAAIAQFTAGKESDFVVTHAIVDLRHWCAGHRDRAFLLIDLLLDIVCAEGPLAPAKVTLVRKLCRSLGLDERQLAALAAMRGYSYIAPEDWQGYQRANDSGRGGPQPARQDAGKDSYAVLGITRKASDAEVKRAYRKLISQHHPDKLGNVPDELKRRAEERARDINAAYEKIHAERGFK
jgi:DnaJ like chaperone protein